MKKLFSLVLTRKTLEYLGAAVGVLAIIVAMSILSKKDHSFDAVSYANESNAPQVDVAPRAEAPAKRGITRTPVHKLTGKEIIELNPNNSVAIRTAITDDSVSSALAKLLALSAKLPKDATIYLVLNTPGGSVDAGLNFIDAVRGIPQKVNTISIFSASMGFHIVQYLGDRLVTPASTLMSHRMRGGIDGQIPGELNVRANMLLDLAEAEDGVAAKRMGLTTDAYRLLIQDEYWAGAEQAIKDHAADRVVLIRCSPELIALEDNLEIPTPFGTAKVVYSGCPNVSSPKRIDVPKLSKDADRERLSNYINLMVRDRKKFVEEYIVTGQFDKFVK